MLFLAAKLPAQFIFKHGVLGSSGSKRGRSILLRSRAPFGYEDRRLHPRVSLRTLCLTAAAASRKRYRAGENGERSYS